MRIKRRKIRDFKFSWINKNSEEIGKYLIKVLNTPNPTNSIIEMIVELRNKYKPREIKLKSHFKIIEKLKKMNDWTGIRKTIIESNTESFIQYLSCFEKLKATRRDKEYFLRLRFYSDLNKNISILNDLSIQDEKWGTSITMERNTICRVVSSKYKKLFKDNGHKEILPLIGNSVILYTDKMVENALFRLNLNKATSWDFIPGKAYEIFLKDTSLIPLLTRLINNLITQESIPEELTLGRLFCLNKNAEMPGSIDNIRPLVIMGVIVKIIERPLLNALKMVKLNRGQIGFKERMSTEVNIIRLKQCVHSLQYDNYKRKDKMPKRYILFIDLKTAFDSVNLKKLIEKLIKKEVPIPIIDTLIKLMNSSKISMNLDDTISINSGVAQGKLCSPLLFNIYIDDLLDITEKICYSSLAFADDTVFICEDYSQLLKVIIALNEWNIENKVETNKKKSGIIIINDDGTDTNDIQGFPVVSTYKYLGVLIDTKLSSMRHVHVINRKIKDYLIRNDWLHKKYFTPMSLIRIVDYFVKSRISYGLCCFLINKSEMNKIEQTLVKFLKSILGVPLNTSHRRLMLVIGEPDLTVRLSLRLLKNWHKYKEQFGEYPLMYENILRKFFEINYGEQIIFPSITDEIEEKLFCYKDIKFKIINDNLKMKAKDYLPCEIRLNHRDFLKKHVFNWTDLRNFHLIRYFTHTTKGTATRLFPDCHCGAMNTPDHGANFCPDKLTNRAEIVLYFDTIFNRNNLEKKNNLYDYFHSIFYTIDNIPPKDIRLLIDKLKVSITSLIIQDKSPSFIEIPDQKFKKRNEEKILNEEDNDNDSNTENYQNI